MGFFMLCCACQCCCVVVLLCCCVVVWYVVVCAFVGGGSCGCRIHVAGWGFGTSLCERLSLWKGFLGERSNASGISSGHLPLTLHLNLSVLHLNTSKPEGQAARALESKLNQIFQHRDGSKISHSLSYLHGSGDKSCP